MKTLNQYAWLFSVCITALGWVWVMAGERAVTQQKLDDMDNRLTAVQQRNQMLDEKLIVIHNSLIQVKTDVRWLRETWADKRQSRSQ
ncbi:MAG: hypothetical protein CMJ19_20425 [Phycisphaeraceae bacterium]|nr:hypothetical protein [Phycisphaeraceae bacterium]